MKIRFLPELHTHRGQLRSGPPGLAVHAASLLPQREMVFDRGLLDDAPELLRIFSHEVFHFVWRRLSRQRREAWMDLLTAEKAKGELGWSAERLKEQLSATDRQQRTRRFRDYACESFCDTAAWFHSPRVHDEYTLAVAARRRRERFFLTLEKEGRLKL
jgi:hypothetical protein